MELVTPGLQLPEVDEDAVHGLEGVAGRAARPRVARQAGPQDGLPQRRPVLAGHARRQGDVAEALPWVAIQQM